MTMQEHGKYVEANGIQIFYREYGQGQPLILIHDGALNSDSWEYYLPGFLEHYRVLTPDNRGHSRTENSAGPLSFRLLADDIAALAQALGLEKPIIYGYSDGGQVTLEIAMNYPDLPGALVIGDTFPELTEASHQWVRSILGDENTSKVDFAAFEQNEPRFAAMLKRLHGAEGWKKLMADIKPMWNARLNHTAADFAKIVAPTLVIMGDQDEYVPVEEGVRLFRQLPTAEYAVVPGADHQELILNPAKVALAQPIILDFLQRHTTATPWHSNK